MTSDRRQARENARVQITIGFGFASHWSRKWLKFYQPITERSKAKSKQSRIIFGIQLKITHYINYVTSSTFFIQIIVRREMTALPARHMEKLPNSCIRTNTVLSTFWNVAHFLADDNRRFNRIVTPSWNFWWAHEGLTRWSSELRKPGGNREILLSVH